MTKNMQPTNVSTNASTNVSANASNKPIKKQPNTGTGGKYNFPNARMELMLDTDEKREFMAKAIMNNLAFFNVGLKPVKTEEELSDRLNYFFAECARTQQLPTVEKMCNCLGYARQTISDWELKRSRGLGPATADIIKKAKTILASLDAELAQEGKIQPVVYMFRAKNFYGMRDQQEIVVTPKEDLANVDQQELAKKYAELPEDLSEDYKKID